MMFALPGCNPEPLELLPVGGLIDPEAAPAVRRIEIPPFPGSYAIWGATGNDSAGRVWFSPCSHDDDHPSAHLFEYDLAADKATDRGNVISELKRCGKYRPGELQAKIHSRIVQAGDGHLYFASMDETDESARSNTPPKWGSHLWRVRLPARKWDHLLSVPEGLVAVTAGERHVYALGYWGHVLYQYDTQTGRSRSVKVGAVNGNISRNIFTDSRGHVYVPRITGPRRRRRRRRGRTQVTLVEFDSALKELAATPLEHYPAHGASSLGISGFAPLPDGSIAFVTHSGYLYTVTPAGGGPAKVAPVGYLHPGGSSSAWSLFAGRGGRYLAAVVKFDGRHEWVVYDLKTGKGRAFGFRLSSPAPVALDGKTMLFGSATYDRLGNLYVSGRLSRARNRSAPLLLQVSPQAGQQATSD